MHEETLAKPTRELFDKLGQYPWLSPFYLAGGTALALRLGHRISIDLDFLNDTTFNESTLIEKLLEVGRLEVFQKERQSVIGSLDSVKFSLFGVSIPDTKARHFISWH